MSEESITQGDDEPMRRGLWIVAAIAIAGLGLIVFLSSSPNAEPGEEIAVPTTTPEPTTTTTSSTSTTSAPATTTTTLLGYESFTVDGTGSRTFDFEVPDDLATVLRITHDGDSGFTVTTFDADDEEIEVPVDVVGDYDGSVAINLVLGDVVSSIQVLTDGDWSITATYLGDLERQVNEASGTGDAVLIMDLATPVMTINHDGESDFSVFVWTFSDQGYLVNETGPIETTVRAPVGGVVLEVKADGNWSLSTGG